MRILLFTGKGGVGKTTLAASTAVRSAQLGHRTLVISTDIAHSLADVLETPLGNEPCQVGLKNLWASELDTAEELERYWGDVRRQIASTLQQEGIDAPAAGELAILPGLDEVLALVRIKKYHSLAQTSQSTGADRAEAYDVMIIDSAPTGAAMRLLSAPDLQRWYARHMAGWSKGLAKAIWPAIRNKIKLPLGESIIRERINQLFDQVTELRGILTDPHQTSVRLVLNPDHMSLQETQRAFTYMNLFGFSVDALYVNRLLPQNISDPFFDDWKRSQQAHRLAIRENFDPLRVFEVPLRSAEVLGVDTLGRMAEALYGPVGAESLDPTVPLTEEAMLRFYEQDGTPMLALRVVGVPAGDVDLHKQGDQLSVRLGRFRRTLVLPQYLAGQQPDWAQVSDGELRIAFRSPE